MGVKKQADRRILLAVSFAIAIVLWFVVSVFLNPYSTRTMRDVPVNTAPLTATLDSMGLSLVNVSAEAVSVDVSGSRIDLSTLDAEDINVTPKISGISKAGAYTLDLTAVINDDGNIEVTAITPKSITVTVARMDTVKLPLKYNVTGAVPEGYFLDSVTIADEFITVGGPADVVSRIETAEVTIADVTNGIRDIPVRLLDKQGNEITDDTLTKSVTATRTEMVLLKTKTLTLNAIIKDMPRLARSSIVTLSVTPETVTVAGPEEVIDGMNDTLTVLELSMYEIYESTVKEINLSLPEGVRTVDGTETVSVEITVADEITVNYIDVRNFVLSEYLQGFDVTVETLRIRNVKIAGTADAVDAVTSEDLIATVIYDETQIPQKGRYTMDVVITSVSPAGFWVVGEYVVNVKVE